MLDHTNETKNLQLICNNFAGTLQLHCDNWYSKVTDLLEKQQTAPIWMSDTKVISSAGRKKAR